MSFQKVSSGDEIKFPPIWDKDTTNVIIGRLIEKREHVGAKDGDMVILENKDGTRRFSVWVSTVLRGYFNDIKEGSVVKIKYLGFVKNKYHNYDVAVGDEEDLVIDMIFNEN